MTETYLIRNPRQSFIPRLVNKEPEYTKQKWGECSACPDGVYTECRRRQLFQPEMPMMCEQLDELDVLTSGIDIVSLPGWYWICEQCGKKFKRKSSGPEHPRFCGQHCYRIWRKENNITGGQFEKGKVPWNKGVKGIHMSPATEFKLGSRPQNTVAVGTEVESQGYIRRKVAEPSVWRQRSHIIWEEHYGRMLPDGWIVRHKDCNPLNDDPHNLDAMPRSRNLAETLKDPCVMKRKKDGVARASSERWKKYRNE